MTPSVYQVPNRSPRLPRATPVAEMPSSPSTTTRLGRGACRNCSLRWLAWQGLFASCDRRRRTKTFALGCSQDARSRTSTMQSRQHRTKARNRRRRPFPTLPLRLPGLTRWAMQFVSASLGGSSMPSSRRPRPTPPRWPRRSEVALVNQGSVHAPGKRQQRQQHPQAHAGGHHHSAEQGARHRQTALGHGQWADKAGNG